MKFTQLTGAVALAHADTNLIITNGKTATMAQEGAFAQALAVQDGQIQAVGSNAQIVKLQTASTQVIDAGGRTVIPA